VADAQAAMVLLARARNAGANIQRDAALAGSSHVVPLAFNRHERWAVDIRKSNRTISRGHEPDRQQTSHEDGIDDSAATHHRVRQWAERMEQQPIRAESHPRRT
jgi:hypothetical protein